MLHLILRQRSSFVRPTIGDKIVETLYSNRVTQENTRVRALSPVPSIQSWGVCCVLFVARTSAQHCMEGMGEEKLYSPLLKLVKRKKNQFGGQCLNSFCRRLQSYSEWFTISSYVSPFSIISWRTEITMSITFARTLMSSLKLAGPGIVLVSTASA